MIDEAELNAKIEAFKERSKIAKEKAEEEERQAIENLRSEYLKRTGRTELKP